MPFTPLPAGRIEDAHSLEADGIVFLYRITPVSGAVICLKANNTVTFQGSTWEGTAIQIDQRGKNSDGQKIRPKLVIANPLAAYSSLVAQHVLDNATVEELQVLYSDLLANRNLYSLQTWRIRKILGLTRSSLTVELRDFGDGQKYLLPGRSYNPPEFPTVSL